MPIKYPKLLLVLLYITLPGALLISNNLDSNFITNSVELEMNVLENFLVNKSEEIGPRTDDKNFNKLLSEMDKIFEISKMNEGKFKKNSQIISKINKEKIDTISKDAPKVFPNIPYAIFNGTNLYIPPIIQLKSFLNDTDSKLIKLIQNAVHRFIDQNNLDSWNSEQEKFTSQLSNPTISETNLNVPKRKLDPEENQERTLNESKTFFCTNIPPLTEILDNNKNLEEKNLNNSVSLELNISPQFASQQKMCQKPFNNNLDTFIVSFVPFSIIILSSCLVLIFRKKIQNSVRISMRNKNIKYHNQEQLLQKCEDFII